MSKILIVTKDNDLVTEFKNRYPKYDFSSLSDEREFVLFVKSNFKKLKFVFFDLETFDDIKTPILNIKEISGRNFSIVAINTDKDKSKTIQSLEAGTNEYLTRPVDFKVVDNIIDKLNFLNYHINFESRDLGNYRYGKKIDDYKDTEQMVTADLSMRLIESSSIKSLEAIIRKPNVSLRWLIFSNFHLITEFANKNYLNKLISYGGRLFDVAGLVTTKHIIYNQLISQIGYNDLDDILLEKAIKEAKVYMKTAELDSELISSFKGFIKEVGGDGSLDMESIMDLTVTELFIFLIVCKQMLAHYIKQYKKFDSYDD